MREERRLKVRTLMRRVKFGTGFEVDIVGNWGRIWNLVLDGGRERRKMVERERRIKRRSGSMFFEVAIDPLPVPQYIRS